MPSVHSPGERIIELRKTYGISLETLSERSGLPAELIQSIEEEGHIPDLAPLIRISRALGVRLGTLLDDHEKLGPVITRSGEAAATVRFVTGLPAQEGIAASSAPPSDTNHQGLHFKALAADKGGRHMEPFIVDIEADAVQEKSTHEGEEFIHVLGGSISLEYGTAAYTLEAGDSAYYDSIVPHRLLAVDAGEDAKPARILAVIYTPA